MGNKSSCEFFRPFSKILYSFPIDLWKIVILLEFYALSSPKGYFGLWVYLYHTMMYHLSKQLSFKSNDFSRTKTLFLKYIEAVIK